MKVGRAALGQVVVLRWLDPASDHTNENVKGPAARGRGALAVQTEIGRIDDITDGVVRICHTETVHPGDKSPGAWFHTWVPEDLVIELVLYAPQTAQPPDLKEGP